MYPNDIGKRLKKLLKIKNIKRKDLAKMLGISYNTLTNKLNGKSEFSGIEISQIKHILNLDIELSYNIVFNQNYILKNRND